VSADTTATSEQLSKRIASLAHSLALAKAVGTATGRAKRNVIKALHHTDIRYSHGEENGVSNPHVDRRHKRQMRIRPEHTGAQRMMRKRQRTIWDAEDELEQFIAKADIDFDADILASSELSESPIMRDAREEQDNG
jgi:hypothetical protein